MEWTEKDVEDCLAEHPSNIRCHAVLGQQVKVSIGIIDLLALRMNEATQEPMAIAVVEIKKGQIDCNAVGQLRRYIYVLEAGRSLYLKDFKSKVQPLPFIGILYGSSVQDDAKYLCSSCGYEIFTYQTRLTCSSEEVWSRNWGPKLEWPGFQGDKVVYEQYLEVGLSEAALLQKLWAADEETAGDESEQDAEGEPSAVDPDEHPSTSSVA